MSAPTIQAQYDSLEEIAKRFDQQADDTEKMVRHLTQMLEQLQGGGWEGDSAQAFFHEMNDGVLPTTNNLQDAFTEAGETTRQIVQILQTAEDEAANQFQITNESGSGQSGGGGSSSGGGGNSSDTAGGSAPGAATPASSTLVQTPTDQVFDEDYMEAFIGSHYAGEDSAELNQLMENLLATDSSNTGSVDSLLNQIADVRGIDRAEFRQQYEVYQQLLANQSGMENINLSQHGDFLGSTASMRYGAVVGDIFGIDPVFGSMLNPTGGLVGPSNDSYNPGDNDAIGYHGIFHDAAGYLYNNHDIGPGYDYLDREPFDTGNPMTGQIGGVSWWAGGHPELDVDFSNAHEAFDIPYVPEFIESGITSIANDMGGVIIDPIRNGMHIYEGGSKLVDGVGQLVDGNVREGISNIIDGRGLIRESIKTLPIVGNGLGNLFGF